MYLRFPFFLRKLLILSFTFSFLVCLKAESIKSTKPIPLYNTSSKTPQIVGSIPVGAEIEVTDYTDSKGFVTVAYITEEGDILSGICKPADLGLKITKKAPPPTSTETKSTTTTKKSSGASATGPGDPNFFDKFSDMLIDKDGSKVSGTYLKDRKYVLVYFSAHWCGPCRAFTPQLASFYNTGQTSKDIEVVFVSLDRSESDQLKYMKEATMPWTAIRYSDIENSNLKRFCGRGIPCLVAFDSQGRIVSDSYQGSNYLGPDKVLNDVRSWIQ